MQKGGLRTKGYNKTSYENKPLISVITVVFNCERHLEETIQSVITQKYDNLEYVIVDGGSTDGTLDIIKKYDDKIDYWISEPDKGIYDAMNKALDLINGKGHIFLNAGDYFVSDIFSETPKIPSFIPVYYKNFFGKIKKVGLKDYRQALSNCHQGIIFETKRIKFNTAYKLAADYLYYLEHGYKNNIEFNNGKGWVFYNNEGATKINYKLGQKELLQIIKKKHGFVYYFLALSKITCKNIFQGLYYLYKWGKHE